MRRFPLLIALAAILANWPATADEPPLAVTADLKLDPTHVYGALIIKASGISIDGQGAWLVGSSDQAGKKRQGIAIRADGVSRVTLKNIHAAGWETGLSVKHGENWIIENCDFSDNFHDPDFGWGENGVRGGIVLEKVRGSLLRNNRANRVWDACALIDSDENTLEANDFSHASNTCLKLWTSSRNAIRGNTLSHGIRISPGEVHARDSTSVLIESGSDDNLLLENDCTHGGDGIFVRVLNSWCSTGNRFEANDCSYANNNGFECWAPRNSFVRNKANHSSYGFWLGGSDGTRLIDNEASFNGLLDGFHNSPHLPGNGHAGIVFMFGSSSHTLARGNRCEGNNGAGIALIGDIESKGEKWRAYHWVLERNHLINNRWGIYARYADWIVANSNDFRDNVIKDVLLADGVTRFSDSVAPPKPEKSPPMVHIVGPTSLPVEADGLWKAQADDPAPPISHSWDAGHGQFSTGPELHRVFSQAGFQGVSLNVSSDGFTEPCWQDVYVVRPVHEIGTEGEANKWSIEDFNDRVRSSQQISRAQFSNDSATFLAGQSALAVVIEPYGGGRAALTYPATRDAAWPLQGKGKLVFWLKAINADVTGWQGGPFVVIHGEDGKTCHLEPKPGRDFMREVAHSEEREGWRLFEIPLQGDERWQRDGELPTVARAISLAFDSWGAPTLRLWIDGLAFE